MIKLSEKLVLSKNIYLHYTFIVPILNASVELEKLIHSLKSQTYKNWKLILIEGDSKESHIRRTSELISNESDVLLKT